MTLLPTILQVGPAARAHQPFLLLQSSAAQSSLPILRELIARSTTTVQNDGDKPARLTLLFCLLYPPVSLVNDTTSQNVRIYDLLANVPGYTDDWIDPTENILTAIKSAPAAPLDVIIDSVDTLVSDLGSPSQVYKFLHELLTVISGRSQQHFSRLIVHLLSPSKLIPMLIRPAFSPSLTHIIVHPPVLLTHLATAYFTPPPPASSPSKFWAIFIPFSERGYETDRLVFGRGGEGTAGAGGDDGEIVVEVVVRGADGSRTKRATERTLEAWCGARGGACELTDLESLKNVFAKRTTAKEVPPDPTQDLSFNVNLTPSQQESRARVPLPYAHEGKPSEFAKSAIFYDPDSADDIDDDDPDEDLDI